MGSCEVRVPGDVNLVATGSAALGQVELLGEDQGGFGPHLETQIDVPGSAGDHRVGNIGRYGTGGGELVNMGSLIAGLVFVILGVLFLLDNLGVFEVSFAPGLADRSDR